MKRTSSRMTFSDLGAFDWGAAIGTAVSAYTGQPNALSVPKPPPAPGSTVIVQTPQGPVAQTVPMQTPYYKNPWIIIPGLGVAGVLVYTLVRSMGRRSRR